MRRTTARLLAPSLIATGLIAAPAAAETHEVNCDTTAEIYEIQGSGHSSPMVGATVTTSGVVTEVTGSNLWLQDPDGDGDPDTSDAINVYWGDLDDRPRLNDGDLVTVCGTVGEYRGLTQIADVHTVQDDGATDPIEPLVLTMPAERDLEAYESMLVSIDQTLYASDLYNALAFGEAFFSGEAPLRVPTDLHEPGSADAMSLIDENSRNSIKLTLGNSLYDDLMDQADRYLRWGDSVHIDRVGHVTETFGAKHFRMMGWPYFVQASDLDLLNDRPSDGPDVGDADLVVASFNVFNYWTSDYHGEYRDCVAEVTEGNPYSSANEEAAYEECGPEPRGHRGDVQKANQRAAIVAAITAMGADIIALQELETPGLGDRNAGDDPNETLIDLVGTLNAAAGAGTWDYVRVGDDFAENTNPIHSGFIYQPDRVTSRGDMLVLTGLADVYDRLPVAATFVTGSETLTVVNNHWKSKGCSGATGLDSDQDDGQACFNATRTAQANAVAGWVDELRTGEGTDEILVVGDLNAYGQEDPVVALREGGLKDLATRWVRGWDRYSYTFFGQAGQLDHAFATRSLSKHITGVDVWHVNAAESNGLSYFGEKPSEARWRSSDHDPIVVGIDFDARPGRGRR